MSHTRIASARVAIALAAWGLITLNAEGAVAPALKAADAVAESPTSTLAPSSKTSSKAKGRRVIILGTTIEGEALKPPIEKTVPWQDPAAFRLEAVPLKPDFMRELLKPLDREGILRDADPDH